jgi:hypothetical protein
LCAEFASAKASKRGKVKAQTNAQAKEKGKKSTERVTERSTEPSPLALGLDSVFVKLKQELDEVVSSPLLHGKSESPINSYFFKTLKENQPFYSLTRVNQTGDVINEMIRLVEKEKTDDKKQNLSKEPWFKQTVKKKAEYSGMIKLEETGRYYLLWAVPIVDNKNKESFEGGLALKIDLWDCFHKFAKNIETPFLIRIDRLHLYSNKWKDTIEYKEEALSVPGVKKIFIRYPKTVSTFVTAPEAPAPVVSSPSEPAAPKIDSIKIKADQDSLKALLMKKDKKKATTRTIIIAVLIILIIIVAILIFIIVPAMKQRALMKHIDNDVT